jgi:ribosomal-protein-serine acetyltransferase
MFCHKVSERTELRPIERHQAGTVFALIDANREHLRRWHPQIDLFRGVADLEKAIAAWQQQTAANRGIYAGIWCDGKFCGMINHLNVDWPNRCAVLSYWLDAQHQGKGIMTACCRAFITHAFQTWKLHRITIECATENARSRAIPERLGFKLEGIVRQVEWLHDHFADHAIYGLLSTDFAGKVSEGKAVRHSGSISRTAATPEAVLSR